MSLAAKLPYDHPYAGGFSGIGSQPQPTDSDCLTYLAAVKAADGAGVEVGVAVAVDKFFRKGTLKPSNCCLLFGARTLKGALTTLDGSEAVTCDGVVSGDYSRLEGIAGDGTTSIAGIAINGKKTTYDPDDAEGFNTAVTNLITAIGEAL
jgi:hypothetical protein